MTELLIVLLCGLMLGTLLERHVGTRLRFWLLYGNTPRWWSKWLVKRELQYMREDPDFPVSRR